MQKTVVAYNLVDFVKLVQNNVQAGYSVDFNDNDSVPTGMTGFYQCKMVKDVKLAALLKPKEQDILVNTVDSDLSTNKKTVSNFDSTLIVSDFKPSVIFETQTKPSVTSKIGRPVSNRI